MKTTFITLIITLLTFHSFGQNLAEIEKEYKKLFGNCLIGDPTQSKMEQHQLNFISKIQSFDLQTLEILLTSKNEYIQLIGLLTISEKYPYGIPEQNSIQLAQNSNELKICTNKKPIKIPFTFQQLALETISNKENKIREIELLPVVSEAVTQFILRYSSFPESYEEITFSDLLINERTEKIDVTTLFSQDEQDLIISLMNQIEDLNSMFDIINQNSYRIMHAFKLKDNTGSERNLLLYFTLNENFKINIIEATISGTTFSSVPLITDWLTDFGRELNDGDKYELNLNN